MTDDVIAMTLLAARSRVAGLVVSFALFELLFARLRFQIYFCTQWWPWWLSLQYQLQPRRAPIGCSAVILGAMLDVSFPGQSARDFVFLLFFSCSLHFLLAFFVIHTFPPRGWRLRWCVVLGEEG